MPPFKVKKITNSLYFISEVQASNLLQTAQSCTALHPKLFAKRYIALFALISF